VSFGKTINTISHLEDKQSTVVVAQPDERHANRIDSVLEWHDRHRAYNIWPNELAPQYRFANLKAQG